jgi:AefR-like transcriptional repressor, C-terminal domain
MAEDVMNADPDQRPRMPSQPIFDARRRVVEAASQLMRDRKSTPDPEPASLRFDAFLALLQDRLPVWHRVLDDLSHLVGKADVNEVLIPVARAAIEFYAEIQRAELTAFSSPDQIVGYRSAMRSRGLGGHEVVEPLATYLAAEQRRGRVATDVDPDAAARLLLGACFQHAYFEVLMGVDVVPPREETADRIVYGLRLRSTAGASPSCNGRLVGGAAEIERPEAAPPATPS